MGKLDEAYANREFEPGYPHDELRPVEPWLSKEFLDDCAMETKRAYARRKTAMIELNGICNIVTAIRTSQYFNREVDIDYIERQAVFQIEFIRAKEHEPELMWHEFIKRNEGRTF